MNEQSARVVELTPVGRAAVAVVLVDGPGAPAAVDRCVVAVRGQPFADSPVGQIRLGRRGGPDGEEVIVCRRASDRFEIHCHGGAAAVGQLVDELRTCGCQPMAWQDWLPTAEPDPIRAAATIALAAAPTARTAAILLDQYHGALAAAVGQLQTLAARGDWSAATAAIDTLLERRGVGEHLTTPWRVVFAGPPNVGKSSLKNALVGYRRTLVCDLPGTTRDVVTTTTAIDGWPVELADTAGVRTATDAVEAAGVSRAQAAAADADLVVLIDEAPSSSSAPPHDTIPADAAPGSTLRVLNKIDRLTPSNQPAEGAWDVQTCALTGVGIDRLVAAIGQRLVPTAPPPGAAVPFTVQQLDCLSRAQSAVSQHDKTKLSECCHEILRAPLTINRP